LTYWHDNQDPQYIFLVFIKTVALNILRDRWRQKKRRGISVNFEEINPEETASQDHQKAVAQRLQLETALGKLSADQRAVLDLRINKGYSVAETAKLLRKTEAAVRTAQYRALQALARLLDMHN
ncbi:MAG: sigma-70 family RNA polymerase sigma factor, partial [Dehalobacterium sp.]